MVKVTFVLSAILALVGLGRLLMLGDVVGAVVDWVAMTVMFAIGWAHRRQLL